MTQPAETQVVEVNQVVEVESVSDVLAQLESQVHTGMSTDEFKQLLHMKLKTVETREKAQFKYIGELRARLDKSAEWAKKARLEMARLNKLIGSMHNMMVLVNDRLTALEAEKATGSES